MFTILCKAQKPPPGWEAIPHSKRGGFRKKTSGGYQYWYPSEDGKKPTQEDEATDEKKDSGAEQNRPKFSEKIENVYVLEDGLPIFQTKDGVLYNSPYFDDPSREGTKEAESPTVVQRGEKFFVSSGGKDIELPAKLGEGGKLEITADPFPKEFVEQALEESSSALDLQAKYKEQQTIREAEEAESDIEQATARLAEIGSKMDAITAKDPFEGQRGDTEDPLADLRQDPEFYSDRVKAAIEEFGGEPEPPKQVKEPKEPVNPLDKKPTEAEKQTEKYKMQQAAQRAYNIGQRFAQAESGGFVVAGQDAAGGLKDSLIGNFKAKYNRVKNLIQKELPEYEKQMKEYEAAKVKHKLDTVQRELDQSNYNTQMEKFRSVVESAMKAKEPVEKGLAMPLTILSKSHYDLYNRLDQYAECFVGTPYYARGLELAAEDHELKAELLRLKPVRMVDGKFEDSDKEKRLKIYDDQRKLKAEWMDLEAQALRHKSQELRKQDKMQKSVVDEDPVLLPPPVRKKKYKAAPESPTQLFAEMEKAMKDLADQVLATKEDLSKPMRKDEDPVEHYIRLFKEGKPLSSGKKIQSKDQAIAIGMAHKKT